jgi:hypothetical protein
MWQLVHLDVATGQVLMLAIAVGDVFASPWQAMHFES